MPRRLSTRLILSLTVIVAIVHGIAGYVSITRQERQLLDAMVLGADQLSRAITSATWEAMLADHRSAAYEIMQTIALKQGINRIRIFNKEGRVMFSTAADDQRQVDKRAEACYLCHASDQPLLRVDMPSRARVYTGHDSRRRLAMVTPIYNEPACSDAACHAHPASMRVLGVLDVALDLGPVDQEIAAAEVQTIGVTVIQVLLIGVLIVLFTRTFVDSPIHKLIEGTRAISAMQLDRPVAIDTSEELGELALSFDLMRQRLKVALTDLNEFTQSLEAKVEKRTTQLKVAQQKLVQTDRLASLGQLAASVAHEINNPLSGVLNLSMLMQRIVKEDGIPPDRLREFRKFLGQVVTETARVGRIVSDLLAFSRRAKPQTVDTDLNAIIRTTHSLIAHKMKLGNIRVLLELADRLPIMRGDPSQMQQVVLNLLMNGADATAGRDGDRVVVMRTTANVEDGIIILEVEDNGEGIPTEHLTKIFDPFFTTKGEGKGVGLGLAVVYGIVEAHGGDITVRSTVGTGTTFTVTLPLTERVGGGGQQQTVMEG